MTVHDEHGDSVAMTAAEFRIAREYLGVPGEWVAAQLGVTDRTVRRWENGSTRVPAGVAGEMHGMVRAAAEFVDAVVAVLREDPVLDDHGAQWITTYASDAAYRLEYPDLPWPAGWHRAAMGRVVERMPGVRVVFAGAPE